MNLGRGITVSAKNGLVGLGEIILAQFKQFISVNGSLPEFHDGFLHTRPHIVQVFQIQPVIAVFNQRKIIRAVSGQKFLKNFVKIVYELVVWLVRQFQLNQLLRGAPHDTHIVDKLSVRLRLDYSVNRNCTQ